MSLPRPKYISAGNFVIVNFARYDSYKKMIEGLFNYIVDDLRSDSKRNKWIREIGPMVRSWELLYSRVSDEVKETIRGIVPDEDFTDEIECGNDLVKSVVEDLCIDLPKYKQDITREIACIIICDEKGSIPPNELLRKFTITELKLLAKQTNCDIRGLTLKSHLIDRLGKKRDE